MATTCGNIASSLIAAACGKAPSGGTDSEVYLVNYADVDKAGSTVTGNVISTLKLKTGAKMYRLVSKAKATTGEATFARGTYFDTFDHSVTLRAFTKNQPTKDFLNNLIGARVMVIVTNNEDGAYEISEQGAVTAKETNATKYELYGWDSGLTLSALPYSTELSDSVFFSATLASDDASKEGELPKTVLSTSIANTKTMLDGLVNTAAK